MIDYYFTPSLIEESLNKNPDFYDRGGYGVYFEKYIEKKFLESKQKRIIFAKEDDGKIIFSWIFEEKFYKSYKGPSEN